MKLDLRNVVLEMFAIFGWLKLAVQWQVVATATSVSLWTSISLTKLWLPEFGNQLNNCRRLQQITIAAWGVKLPTHLHLLPIFKMPCGLPHFAYSPSWLIDFYEHDNELSFSVKRRKFFN
jgi:hypothetical protein